MLTFHLVAFGDSESYFELTIFSWDIWYFQGINRFILASERPHAIFFIVDQASLLPVGIKK